jgi:hypothetical protein
MIAVVGILLTLQGATLAYVVKIERRLTRLETLEEIERPAARCPLNKQARAALETLTP